VLRAASPASSIGTTYGEDQTSFSDCEHQINQADFERKWEARLELGTAREEEELANVDPLLVRPPEGSAEEAQLYERVVYSLRDAVQMLEENELFEKTLLRGSQAALEQQPSTSDIDSLLRSMMVTPQQPTTDDCQDRGRGLAGVTDGPWVVNGTGDGTEGEPKELLALGRMKPGKRSRNGSRRN